MSLVWLDKDKLFSVVLEKLENVAVVLDIGCGIMPQPYVLPLVHICCEPFEQYVVFLQNKTKDEYDRNYVIIKSSWSDAVRLFPLNSVDSVFLIDVIEHLEKEAALELLKATEALARRQIVLFTPLGFMPQHHPDGKDAWGLEGGKWQEHKSGWQPEDFDASWDVYAAKDYHSTDNMGVELDKPFGAMWAIKNNTQEIKPESVYMKRYLLDITQNLVSYARIKNIKIISSIIEKILVYAQTKDVNILGNIIQKLIQYSSSIDLRAYSTVLNLYVFIKYSKLLVISVNKFRKLTARDGL